MYSLETKSIYPSEHSVICGTFTQLPINGKANKMADEIILDFSKITDVAAMNLESQQGSGQQATFRFQGYHFDRQGIHQTLYKDNTKREPGYA